jgi:3-dehydroquinate dehydratase/shikimate dehydrogenase
MLIASLAIKDYSTAKQSLFQLADRADGVEFRLDYAPHWDLGAISALRQACTLPVIFTLRRQTQGGHYPHTEAERLQTLLNLCALNPDYVDLEYDVPQKYIQAIRQRYPAVKIILSYHNFAETPPDLVGFFKTMQQTDCFAYKIATQAQSVLDALRMLQFVMQMKTQHRIIGLCMGEAGQCTRILAPIVGSLFSYAAWDPSQTTAPGQLSLQDLTEIYHYRQLNDATKIYVLLGDPVQGSVGHIVHNRVIRFLQKNAVYVKIRVSAADLPMAMHLLHGLPCVGGSITMPLKEKVLPLLQDLDPSAQVIQAVNTFVMQDRRWIGMNTDGLGAMQAVAAHLPLAGQTIVLFGAGGAARALAVVASQQGAKLIILNRTLEKAKQLAEELHGEAYPLDMFPTLHSYTLCINTLPESAFQTPELQAIWQPKYILPESTAMDIVYQPRETYFLNIAKAAGCQCIFGHHMYINQAILQIQHWFQPSEETLLHVREMMERYFM